MRRRRTTHQPGASPFPPSPRSPSHCVRAHPTEEVARQTSWVKWPVSVLEGIGRTSVLFSPVQCSPVQSRVHPSKPTFTDASTISKHVGNPPPPPSLLSRLLRTHKEIRTHLNPPSSKSYPSLSSPHALTALSTSAYPAARFSPAGPPECSNAHCSLQACAVAASDSFQDSGAAACWRRNRLVVLRRAVWKVGVDVYCGDGDDEEEEVGEESWGEAEARALGRETEREKKRRVRREIPTFGRARGMVGRAGGFEMG